jgi:alpha 1,6-mannosyltransferase
MLDNYQHEDYAKIQMSEVFHPLLENESDDSRSESTKGSIIPRIRTRSRKIITLSITISSILAIGLMILYTSHRRQGTNSTLQRRLQQLYPHHRSESQQIPSLIWQTWKTHPGDKEFAEELQPQVDTWSIMNPNHTQIELNDAQAMKLVKSLYRGIPQVYEAYTSMPMNVQRADFFRYLILFALGGIYTDIDTRALKPFDQWLDSISEEETGIVIGVEVDAEGIPNWADLWARRLQFCQWTIASKPGHPILAEIITRITQDTLNMKEGLERLTPSDMKISTLEYTGPGVWTDVVLGYLGTLSPSIKSSDLVGLTSRKLIDDVVILPITSFSPGEGRMGSEPEDHPMAFVRHRFQGEFFHGIWY